ncbi:hypothetical protein [Micromonospora mirobrigensis]|uniref:Uncharacterized protein n=1 Tax=Micromonospora mirobrigensis TaxID=262898 RepID=A0A1C4WQ11_9ACTN|nr:hypothetical protein [Micromonospora mirobrigensis]SCE98249.1 hypothetical protein GA0070564_102429 [Micromonospora mirobrigensis]
MYLVVVAVEGPDRPVGAGTLRETVYRSAAEVDRLEHAHVAVVGELIVFSLYVQVADPARAVASARQLCRRTMAVHGGQLRWRLRATALL